MDAQGNAYVGGSTRSSALPDDARRVRHDPERRRVRRTLRPVRHPTAAGNGPVYSTFAGGSKSDFGSDFAVDGAGNAYLVGSTLSPDFPGVSGGSFALKLDPAGGSLIYSRSVDGAGAVAPAGDGSVWLAGGRGGDAWIGRLDATGTTTQRRAQRRLAGGREADLATAEALHPPASEEGVRERAAQRARQMSGVLGRIQALEREPPAPGGHGADVDPERRERRAIGDRRPSRQARRAALRPGRSAS